jgi:hypothetical protein
MKKFDKMCHAIQENNILEVLAYEARLADGNTGFSFCSLFYTVSVFRSHGSC